MAHQAVCSAGMSGRACILTHLLNWSTMMRMYLLPHAEDGKGPSMSIWTRSMQAPAWKHPRPALGFSLAFLFLLHVEHVRTYSTTSCCMSCQIKDHFTLPSVFLWPKCPAMGQSWQPCNTSSLIVEGTIRSSLTGLSSH